MVNGYLFILLTTANHFFRIRMLDLLSVLYLAV